MTRAFPRLATHTALTALGLPGLSVAWHLPAERTPSGGFAVTLRLAPGATVASVTAAADRLAVALGVDCVEVRRTAPRRVRLTAQQPLPLTLPRYPEPSAPGLVPAGTPCAVPLGLDRDGYPAELVLFDDAGGTVTLLAGSPGTGKSSALRLLVAGLMHTRTSVLWLDPKGGADAARFAARVEAVGDASQAAVALGYLRAVNALAARRAMALAAGDDLRQCRRLVVIVDEWATLGADGTKQDRAEVETELRRLAATGRASHIALVLATQRPTATSIDVTTRSLAGARLAFAVGDVHASTAALGVPGAELLDPKTDRGTALLNDSSRIRPVRLHQVPTDLTARADATRGLCTTVAELQRWETACLPVTPP